MIRRRTPLARSTTPLKRTALKRSEVPLKRTPLKRSERPTRLAARSKKAIAKQPERVRVVAAAWERDGGRCRAELVVPFLRCGGVLDVHELVPRSTYPGGELDLDNVICICRIHHEWVGDNPRAAHAVGLHRYAWERLRVVGD